MDRRNGFKMRLNVKTEERRCLGIEDVPSSVESREVESRPGLTLTFISKKVN